MASAWPEVEPSGAMTWNVPGAGGEFMTMLMAVFEDAFLLDWYVAESTNE